MTVQPQSMSGKKQFEVTEFGDAEARLPYWARSTNPIVRRHLGLYWRTVPPDFHPFIVIYLVWVVIMASGILLPGLFAFTMISFLAAIMVIPMALLLYAHVLLTITIEAARAMQMEMKNNTFNLLRTTPMSLTQIFLGKVAAAVWKRMDDLVLVAQLAVAFSPPIIFAIYSDVWSMNGGLSNAVAPIMTLVMLAVILLRIVLEPVMIGVISVFVGTVVPGRSRAITSSVVVGVFYYLLLNLVSRLPTVRGYTAADGSIVAPNGGLIIFFDMILPVVLPLLVIFVLLHLGRNFITSE